MDTNYTCEFCSKYMSIEDYEFCDICGDCRDEEE